MTAAWTSARGTVELRPGHRRWRFWLEQGRDELPRVRDYADTVPFRRGQIHRPGIADTRRLELRGYVQEVDDAAMQAQVDLLKSLLDPETDEPGILEDDFGDGTHRWIRAVPRSVGAKYGGAATRMLSIELEALDPFWHGSWGSLALDAGYEFDAGYELDASAELVVVPETLAETVLVDTLGTADVERIRVQMTGPSSTAPGLEVVTPKGLVGFVLEAPLEAGDTLVLDNWLRTITVNGTTVRAAMTLRPANRHGEYVRLLPGENTVRVLGQPAEARIQFTPTYL